MLKLLLIIKVSIFFILPLYQNNIQILSSIILGLISFLIFINYLLLAKKLGTNIINNKKIWIYMFFFLLYVWVILLSVFASGSYEEIYLFIPYNILSYLLLGIEMIVILNSFNKLQFFLKYIFVVTFLTGPVVGLIQYFNREMFYQAPYFDSRRLVTLNLFDPNYAILPLLLTIILNIYFLNKSKKIIYIALLYSTILITLAAMFLTLSRSGVGVTVLSFLLSFFLFRWYRKFSVLKILFVIIGIVGLLLVASNGNFFETISSDDRLNDTGNADSRFHQWYYAYKLVNDNNLVLGLGKKDYILEIGNLSGQYMTTHNLFLHIFVQRGLLGLTFLLILLLFIYVKLFRSYYMYSKCKNIELLDITSTVIVGLTAYLCMAMTLSDSVGFYIWFYLAITLIVTSFHSEEVIINNTKRNLKNE